MSQGDKVENTLKLVMDAMGDHNIDEANSQETLEKIVRIINEYSFFEDSMPKNILTHEIIEKRYEHSLTVGDIKKIFEQRNISDDVKVVVERVEDRYYKKNGWGVLLKGGYWYYSAVETNNRMKIELAKRANGEESDYPDMKDPSKFIVEDEKILDRFKSQYSPAECVWYDDEKVIYINLHI